MEYILQDLNNHAENYYKFFHEPEILIHLSWEGVPNYQELFHIAYLWVLCYKLNKIGKARLLEYKDLKIHMLDTLPIYRFTIDEYRQMPQANIFHEDDR